MNEKRASSDRSSDPNHGAVEQHVRRPVARGAVNAASTVQEPFDSWWLFRWKQCLTQRVNSNCQFNLTSCSDQCKGAGLLPVSRPSRGPPTKPPLACRRSQVSSLWDRAGAVRTNAHRSSASRRQTPPSRGPESGACLRSFWHPVKSTLLRADFEVRRLIRPDRPPCRWEHGRVALGPLVTVGAAQGGSNCQNSSWTYLARRQGDTAMLTRSPTAKSAFLL